jgi:DNA-binding CsgD family transcriptional regulator
MLDGKQPSDVAIELHLSPSTVSTHIRHIKEKLGAHSTADLVRYGFRAGLIEP